MKGRKYRFGIDVGSVSINLAVLDKRYYVIEDVYVRHRGDPLGTTAAILENVFKKYGMDNIFGIASTGSGGRLLADILNGIFVNEVISQAAATSTLHPEVMTVIDIGGEDSKIIFLKPSSNKREAVIADFAMNTMCAAGTGSFLDQQASRLGLTIEEFGRIALKSENPPRVAGRCSVFAKSDMIHLQQKATPVYEIAAGLCYALARNFRSTVGSGRAIKLPVSFQGGVAANPGIVRALRQVLELEDKDFFVPEHFAAMGAIGAVLKAGERIEKSDLSKIHLLKKEAARKKDEISLEPLRLEKSIIGEEDALFLDNALNGKVPAYLGIDIGSISTNLVIADVEGNVLAKRYLMTAGNPIMAVRTGLSEIGAEVGERVEIKGVCTTGSGRYLIADFVGADVVKNEITAQARGALRIDPDVDTIFEIGGQDSKYIRLNNGKVVDFEMNKVCAAGTGSFLEEQAERLGISIKDEFSNLAFDSQTPASLGERCTVFMETELSRHQQHNAPIKNLVAGLAYSIVHNYLNRVVARKSVGEKIFFQGGTAFNKSVVAAFEKVTGKPITVPPHKEVTGALGCALIAAASENGGKSKFKGFDLGKRPYDVTSIECRDCPNRCNINKVTVKGEEPLFYGSRCEKYDTAFKNDLGKNLPDLFAEREKLLLGSYQAAKPSAENTLRIGIPRALLFHDLFPLWQGIFRGLGCEIVISDRTNKKIIHDGVENSIAETCFPLKIALGHIYDLLDKGIDYIFLPSIINLGRSDKKFSESFVCPYVQSFPYTVQAAVDFSARSIEVLQPPLYFELGRRHIEKAFEKVVERLGINKRNVKKAVTAGFDALERFRASIKARGKEVLASCGDDKPVVLIVSRPYNGYDQGANLDIPRKLRRMGVNVLPMDFLPLDEEDVSPAWWNMYWKYGQNILSAASIITENKKLYPLYVSNFGCGPDSFLIRYFQEAVPDKPLLVIEVDEHSADAGIITRCEAFLDSIEGSRGMQQALSSRVRIPAESGNDDRSRKIMIPNMSAHSYALAAVLKSFNKDAAVLPPPDEDTLYWGRKYTSGRECFPCIVTTGDIVKCLNSDGCKRDEISFFMGSASGPCRFGQYNSLQRFVLDDLGCGSIPMYALSQAKGFHSALRRISPKFARAAWRAMVAIDILDKALLCTRPYETEKGRAQAAYDASVADVCETILLKGDICEALSRSRERFASVPVDKSNRKPLIGILGEFYIRFCAFSNLNLIEKVEELGGECWLASAGEWFQYINFRTGMRGRLEKEYGNLIKSKLQEKIMTADENLLSTAFNDFLHNSSEPPTEKLISYAEPYIHKSFEGEAIMTIGKGIDFIRENVNGIITVMPFTCMPGTISYAVMKKVRETEKDVPYLNMVYDGFEQSNYVTRLEAFMHQARLYRENK